jgi:trans-aconitate methyltransferase
LQFAEATRHVHGYDIAAGNLALAKKHAKEFRLKNTTFHLLRSVADYDSFKPYDFFYSNIVFQHNPPPVQKIMLEKIVAKALPGALLFFQVPVYSSDYVFDPATYLRAAPVDLEMHVLPQAVIFDVLWGGGCRVLEVMEDYATNDPHWISMCFLAKRQ